ncbi:ParB/RepB/Spo0J family partition protein [Murimonas intestini]|uniref:ParB family chromosome partitioning protein n=1 Tax=Murimonas intestini TaxID=1337051 RepID=A0AB73SY00_9FIRM|nr:ParB/RepB/Spo0J family partition protein [Murimonas intestini]MCR1843112.1 ParB/RepB/Spo0J family partition protein [Murimonas intestini]MCR1868421.1 ParB/RepB/Spo0J family partition protein [Murimonas intestini]MCR1885865.1 ParB/RepB/Spo0J family partition protein [Murimonas intestini]
MAVKKTGLGKGLDSLIQIQSPKKAASEPKQSAVVEKVVKKEEVMLKITEIEPNREQPRKSFDEDSLLELAESIKQFGVIQPLIVQKKDDYYEIIAGERRWRAAKLAGLKEIPVIVKQYTEQEIVEISLIENIQRENLNPIEEAQAYKRLLTEFKLKQDEVAERVSKSRTAVTNSMRLLKLDERVQQMVIDDMISTGHARALLALEDKDQQYHVATRIFDEKLSVRETERLMKSLQSREQKEVKKKPEIENAFIYKDIEEKIKGILGTKVYVNHKTGNKGKIEIEYYSNEELERLLELFETIK